MVEIETSYETLHIHLTMPIHIVVHFKKKTFADNLLTLMSSKMSMSSFFSRKEIKVFDENIPGFSPYNGLHWEPNGSRSK